MKLIKQLLQSMPPRFFFVGDNGSFGREQDIFDEVFEVLNEYRSRRDRRESIIVESPTPLTDADKRIIRNLLGASENTPIIERRSPGIGAAIQIMYNGTVYTFSEGDRLGRLKSRFL